MIEWADNLIYSPVGEGLGMIAVVAGISGIVMLVFGLAGNTRMKLIAWGCIGIMMAFIAFSMLFEELLPNWPLLPAARRLPYALSFAGFMLFVVMIILSTQRLMLDGLYGNLLVLLSRGKASPGARSEAFRALRPGLLMFAASAAVFTASLVGYHGTDLMLGRAPSN